MKIHWEFIAECLRLELADYGGLLHLFERQQQALFDHRADAVLDLSGEIESQTKAVGISRSRREDAVASYARQLGQPASTTLRALLPVIEEDARPLLVALIHEVNALLFRVRRTSRHNHSLLSRAVELHQESLRLFVREPVVQTYSPAGRMTMANAPRMSSLSVAG